MAGPEPGWYPDPEHDGAARYWDGAAWTDESIALEHVPTAMTSSPPPPPPPESRPLAGPSTTAAPEAPSAPPAPSSGDSSGARRAWLIAGYGLLVAAAAVAGFAYGHREDGSASASAPAPATGIGSTAPSSTAAPVRDADQTGGPITVASVSASSTRPSASDACSPPHSTPFDASNLTDGRPDSAWMPAEGDSRPSVTLTFAAPVRVSSLRIVNGYPKRDPCRTDLYRYYQFMRPTLLAVDLHDGNAPRQVTVADSPDAQTLAVSGTTNRMTLTIVQSAPPDSSRIVSGTQIPFSIPAIGELTVSGTSR